MKYGEVYIITPLYNFFHKKEIVQGFLMYNEFGNKTLQRKVTLYDKDIIQRKLTDW